MAGEIKIKANQFGPYADRLRHLLDALDGSYLRCEKRIADASPMDVIWFDDSKKEKLQSYLNSKEMKPYMHALERTTKLIDGFESHLGWSYLQRLIGSLQKNTVKQPSKV